MQLIFHVLSTPEEYHVADKDTLFPKPESCPNPACRMPIPPIKHNFYSRGLDDIEFHERISIRRYYCKHCHMTFSYLPSFCLPYFRYSLKLIFIALLCHICQLAPIFIALVQARKLWLTRQHRQFYSRRFLSNLTRIQMELRILIPYVELPESQDIRKRAQKVLNIVLTEFPEIQPFSQRFFAQCGRSFMTPCKLV